MQKKIKVLVVAHRPLGGIRTYMRYTYKYLSKERFDIAILTQETHENNALYLDAKDSNCKLVVSEPILGKKILFFRIFQILMKEKFDLIQSQGFISGVHTYFANLLIKLPHILTIHGIVEKRLMGKNIMLALKQNILKKIINSVDILYGVSEDILNEVSKFAVIDKKIKKVVIHNGIDTDTFKKRGERYKSTMRKRLGISESIFLIGFLGRFMPQKGFNYLIDAVKILESKNIFWPDFKVLAVGSGDYIREYKNEIEKASLKKKFIFIPFQRDIVDIYQAIDVVTMPSKWEAFPLQPAETMCLGVPIIVSDCMGLRECVEGTPAIMVATKDSNSLSNAILHVMKNYSDVKNKFENFTEFAIKRYDVRKTASKVANLFETLVKGK